MTDRKLLELAAKAAGIKPFCWVDQVKDCDSQHYGGEAIQISHSSCTWNPLTDDGDALRLAVKLELGIAIYDDRACAGNGDSVELDELISDDPYAATRRAIVRAAAEIGKTK